MKNLIKKIIYVFFIFNVSAAAARDNKDRLDGLIKGDSTNMDIFASYNENMRNDIFLASTEAKGVRKLGRLQEKTNRRFTDIISNLSKDDQNKVWNLTRYNNLINQLAGKTSTAAIEAVLQNYPKDVHDDALNYALNHNDLLVKIASVNNDFSTSFERIIKKYSAETQSAFREVVNHPEIISLLVYDDGMTKELGDIYKDNPDLVKQEFTTLHRDLTAQKKKDIADWKEMVKNDPDAAKELKESETEYAKSHPYSEDEYTDSTGQQQYYPYPYWAGYPWWFEYPWWYPYPYWDYGWGFTPFWWDGFYYGFPSYPFVYWNFNYYSHFYHYPHLTDLYLRYYRGPRGALLGRNEAIIHNWRQNEERAMPDRFLEDDHDRASRIQEYGKMEMDREQYNRANPSARYDRPTFFRQHAASYPHLQSLGGFHSAPRGYQPSVFRPMQGGRRSFSAPSMYRGGGFSHWGGGGGRRR